MRRAYASIAGLLLSTAILSAIGGPVALASPKTGPIRIGAAGPYSGDLSKIGLDALNAIKFALDEVNKGGGIDGRKIELSIGDDSADPSKALLVTEKFGTDASIVGVIGPMNSACVAASLPSYQQVGLPIITPSAGNSGLGDRGMSVFHRLCSRDDAQGPVIAKFITTELKARRVYVLDDKTTYGQSLADQAFKSLDGKDLAELKRGQVSADDKDLSPILTRIKAEKPDVVFMGLSSPAQAAALVKQAPGVGLRTTFMGGTAQKERDQFIKGSSGLAEGSYVLSVGKDIHDVPAAKDFVTRFERKHGAISAFSSQAYEATNVLIDAIRRAADKGKEVTRASVQKALDATDGFKGVLGFPISFNKKGDLVGYRIYVLKVKDGDFDEAASYAASTK